MEKSAKGLAVDGGGQEDVCVRMREGEGEGEGGDTVTEGRSGRWRMVN